MKLLVVGYAWEGLFQRSQQLALQMARSDSVVYWQNLGFWGRLAMDACRGQRTWREFVHAGPVPGLTVVSVPQTLPYRTRPAASGLNLALVTIPLRMIPGVLPRDGFDASVLTTYEPVDADVWEHLPARVRVYDCCDDSAYFFPAGSAAARRVIETEAGILRRADLVLASAPALFDRLSQSHPNVILVPNGADAEHFRPGQKLPVPDELADVSGQIAGYIGAVEQWIDVDLIAKLADRLPDYTLALVGPIGCDVTALKHQRNVRLLGRRPYAQLPVYLQRFDVALVPFRDNALTRAVDPIKFYEYCAAGKPVVSTPLPTMTARNDIAYIAATSDEFANQIRRAIAEDSDLLRERRIALARANSWAARADRIMGAISDLLSRGSQTKR